MKTQEEIFTVYRQLLSDWLWRESVNEIYLNGDGSLWVDDVNSGVNKVLDKVDRIATTKFWDIVKEAYPQVDSELIVEGELPFFKARLECLHKPLFEGDGDIIFAIRKQATTVFTLQSYRDNGVLMPVKGSIRTKEDIIRGGKVSFKHPVDVISDAVMSKKNILVVGGTGSGKTTLTNAILAEIAALHPNDRVITIEDTLELQINVKNKLSLRTNRDTDIKGLLRCCMRLHPNRIIVGEVRGGEAYSLLKAWNSGHPGGVATLHANNAAEALEKLSHYIFEDDVARSFSQETVGRMIANSVDLVIVIEYSHEYESRRRVTEICEVKGYMNGRYNLSVLVHQSLTGLCEFKPQI
ncbi:P-type conjugative transfer ATPase TrbB [Salmonella enterica]|uniref:ATPase, T2SS/T4P/T4SS family n=1 Tax=Salmonella enterica TaxID=28901 RepID=UPI001283709E|nr:ATPase, T2SS/T4P/T4SS family [Salmonella enterica]EDS4242086.1 P-type conjugative transfer ATPase TrbB [Salmonella enterica subsp. enterica]HEC9487995.1 Flp pilus assembly complex ATPase component TadA [Salmonella enterica subsp. enterica serovar Orientalis]EAS1948229.1 P-type conjugative transfer ATPase TrbB [Salmonella enterica]EAX1287058.1 P-type conjugative transfer ATPase TrbB [Salmonella enterica]EAX2834719.1 P-type conjugative transfer ATPase TrbB [Salmonella enterica]